MIKTALLGVWTLVLLCSAPAVLAETLSARLDWVQRLVVSTPESGRIAVLKVAPGDVVRGGQVLLQLEPGALQAQRAEAEAALAAARLEVAEAERERDRTQELYDRTLLSDHEVQLVQIALARARQIESAAQTALAHAQLALEYAAPKAPWDGQVAAVYVQPGQAVVNTDGPQALVELVAGGPLLARAQADAAQLRGLRIGTEVQVEVQGKAYRARVRHVGLDPVPGDGAARYTLEALINPVSDIPWRAGSAARIQLP